MDFGTAISTCLGKYAVFNGRARRSEYWFFFLFCTLVDFGADIVEGVLNAATQVPVPIATIVSLALFLPSFAAAVRRLHDVGWSGWWWGAGYLLGFALAILWFAAFVYVNFRLSAIFTNPLGVTALLSTLGAVGYAIMVFVLMVLPGTPSTNRYGPDPKAPNVDVF